MRARLSDDQGWRKNRHDHHKGCARTPTSDRVSPQLSTTHSDFAEPVRPVCLPVLARLWRPRQSGKIAHARQLAELIAARYPDRTVHLVGDAAYVGKRLRDLDGLIT